ncbi:HTH-type transcriptional regulator YesS [compost metagenome]
MELLSILEDEGRDSRYPSSVMKLAERAEIYLRQHYQSEITNELLGRVLHFHPNYIVRCMKEIFRCTPMEYLNRIRMEQAKLLLIKTEWPIVKVAEHVGFQYAPYFSACFKRYTGMPPQAFRQLYFN